MRSLLFVLFFYAIASLTKAADLKYPVSEIPGELKENVDYVVRNDEMIFKILGKNHATLYVHYVVTIFNEKGNGHASQHVGYDKLLKVNDISGQVYDANGKQIKKLKGKDVYDHAAFDAGTLFSDDRVKSLNLAQATYPYTVEIEYELEYKYLYSIPPSYWGSERGSIMQASYQLIYPSTLPPHYKVLNIQLEPVKETLPEGFESMTWKLQNIKPMKFESFSKDPQELVPQIMAAPSVFEYDGHLGSMQSWKEYGKWNQSLNNGRDQLSETTKKKIVDLTANLKDNEQKTKAIYEFVQGKTRYVSVQLGIGGLQPFPASVVDEMGYGDCKALSNYTVALLKEAGVKGYYTVIEAGPNARGVQTDFPAHQFNHVVVAVPNDKDTLWLECTSQNNPFGYQGTFTEDRWALMITDEGGKLVRTLNYKPEQNVETRSAAVQIDAAGNATAKVRSVYSGIQYEDVEYALIHPEKQKEWIEENTQIPNFKINAYSMTQKKDKIPSATVNLDLTLNRLATVSGKRLFVTPNLMNRISYIPEKIADRKTEVVRKRNYIDTDTIQFFVPENLYPEFIPEPIKIKSKFGEYDASFQFDNGKVTYIRRMKSWKGRYAKETYNELVDFFKSVSKADNIKLVFLSKT